MREKAPCILSVPNDDGAFHGGSIGMDRTRLSPFLHADSDPRRCHAEKQYEISPLLRNYNVSRIVVITLGHSPGRGAVIFILHVRQLE